MVETNVQTVDPFLPEQDLIPQTITEQSSVPSPRTRSQQRNTANSPSNPSTPVTEPSTSTSITSNPSAPQPPNNASDSDLPEPPFKGWIETTGDALLIFEAARRGFIARVTRRLVESERNMIRSGSVFVFDEAESGIRRWTDGYLWSPSRMSGNFMVYRETEKSRCKRQARGATTTNQNVVCQPDIDSKALSRPKVESATGIDRHLERKLVGSLTDESKFKKNGLIKKTFSISLNKTAQHLISYYTIDDVEAGRLRTPQSLPELASLEISADYLELRHFKHPPVIEYDIEDGRPRYRCDQELPDVEKEKHWLRDEQSPGDEASARHRHSEDKPENIESKRKRSDERDQNVQPVAHKPKKRGKYKKAAPVTYPSPSPGHMYPYYPPPYPFPPVVYQEHNPGYHVPPPPPPGVLPLHHPPPPASVANPQGPPPTYDPMMAYYAYFSMYQYAYHHPPPHAVSNASTGTNATLDSNASAEGVVLPHGYAHALAAAPPPTGYPPPNPTMQNGQPPPVPPYPFPYYYLPFYPPPPPPQDRHTPTEKQDSGR